MAKADKNAWEAAHKAARKLLGREEKDYKYKPLGSIWYEISAQLRQNGDRVDLGRTQGMWTTESQQRTLMHDILQEAGFKRDGDGEVYYWPRGGKAAGEAIPESKADAKVKSKGEGKSKKKKEH